MNNLRNSPYLLVIALAAGILVVVGIYSLLALPFDSQSVDTGIPAVLEGEVVDNPDTSAPIATSTGPATPLVNIACTMDAKICPDGSGVGRVPPRCEFAPCP